MAPLGQAMQSLRGFVVLFVSRHTIALAELIVYTRLDSNSQEVLCWLLSIFPSLDLRTEEAFNHKSYSHTVQVILKRTTELEPDYNNVSRFLLPKL